MGSRSYIWITGLVLFGLATIWSVLVYQTIPTGQGEGDVGPRAFPLMLGIMLAVLSAIMIVQLLVKSGKIKEVISSAIDPEDKTEHRRNEIKIALSVFITVIAYGFLLQKLGFLIATIITVIGMMIFILKSRRPMLIASMAVGLAVGCWLIFGKLIGAYLPIGTWISLG